MTVSALPDRPLSQTDIEDLHNLEKFETVVPLYVEDEDEIQTLAIALVEENRIHFLYADRDGWRQFAKHELDDPPVVHTSDPPHSSVSIIGTDAQPVRELANDWGDVLQDEWKVGFVPYGTPPEPPGINKSQDECACNGMDSSTVERIPTTTEIDGEFVYACVDCYSLHGIEYRGKKRNLDRITDEEWLFSGGVPGEILEAGDDDTYLLRTVGTDVGRLERVIGALCFIGGARSRSFSPYDPQDHEGLIHLRQGKVTGYLSWQAIDGLQIHRQIFIRDQFRRQGVASTLVQEWCERYCTEGEYYVDEPNPKSKKLLEKLGHRDPNGAYRARELYNLRSVGNDIDSVRMLAE